MSLSLPPHPEPQMTYLQDAVWSHFQALASAASPPPERCLGGAGGCRQLGAGWTGHRKSRALHILTPAPTRVRAQACLHVQRYSHLCGDVDPNACARGTTGCVPMYQQRTP